MMNGLVHHEFHQGEMTAERFNQFLHDTSLQCNNVVLLMQICQLNLKYSTYHFINLWKQALKTRLAEVPHDLPDQPFNERMATLAQLVGQETVVVTPDAMAAAFRGMQAYMPRCFDMEDILM
ncbi:hypothetical protein ElyMa_000496800 [Elysia marginata]|uniref:RGS domain-containing protein n=1 Tax=Elysia marginata TaxID=1093978 RepID=A0AAV4FV77_9GAST|nr:hypothetical protein ElyMa_000496800 [Elysia marginata]